MSIDRLPQRQRWIVAMLRARPMADTELVERYPKLVYIEGAPRQSSSGLRTRRKELVDLGIVRDSGRRTQLPSGRMAIVWEIHPDY